MGIDPFCVQSVSKAFNYAIVASDLGADFVHSLWVMNHLVDYSTKYVWTVMANRTTLSSTPAPLLLLPC
uniref:Glutaminase n=1 Tax=Ditylenchus dipsaci TaxID=166011 RepID=A0A915EGR1_9BILA